jgi:hypothetical protein
MPDLIHGKVARILNTRELIINRGKSDGVRIGMRFAVLDTAGEGVTDPDTGEELGSLQRTKVQVEVTQLDNKICVGRTYVYREVNVGGSAYGYGDIARIFSPPKYERQYETLSAEDADWQPLSERDSIVKVGDPVVQIVTGDDEEVGGVIGGPAPQASLPASGQPDAGGK